MLKKLGLEWVNIKVCKNNCILYHGVYVDHVVCPSCGARMRRHGNSLVPNKILRHFPLTKRLKRVFRSCLQALCMTWIAREREEDGSVRHVSQSKHMDNIRAHELEFCADPWRLFRAFAKDGMNPFSEKRSVYSTRLVTLMKNNIPL